MIELHPDVRLVLEAMLGGVRVCRCQVCGVCDGAAAGAELPDGWALVVDRGAVGRVVCSGARCALRGLAWT